MKDFPQMLGLSGQFTRDEIDRFDEIAEDLGKEDQIGVLLAFNAAIGVFAKFGLAYSANKLKLVVTLPDLTDRLIVYEPLKYRFKFKGSSIWQKVESPSHLVSRFRALSG